MAGSKPLDRSSTGTKPYSAPTANPLDRYSIRNQRIEMDSSGRPPLAASSP